MKTVLQYDQNEGMKAGGGDFVSEGGPYVCQITEAKYTKARTGTMGLEFSIKTQDGLSARFITVYYQKGDGEIVKGGHSLIQAMMGLLKIQGISVNQVQDGSEYCPEFQGKKIGLFLQKKLYTKNDGADGYKFEISVPFNIQDRRTLRELIDNKPAQTIDRMEASYSDKDERGQNSLAMGGTGVSGGSQQGPGQNQFPPADQFDDDIPF